jgi:hypothetical protein
MGRNERARERERQGELERERANEEDVETWRTRRMVSMVWPGAEGEGEDW